MWIEAQANGTFIAVERYLDPLTGKRKRVSIKIDKDTRSARKQAEDALRLKIEKITAPAAENSDLTVRDIADLYEDHQKRTVKPQTWERDAVMIPIIRDLIGADVLASRITARHILAKLEETEKENVTKNTYITHIKRMLRWAYRNDYVEDVSYLDKIKPYPDNKKERIEDKFLSSDELKALINGMKITQWKLLTEFLALSGLRIGEAMALLDTDVTDVIIVNKTANTRTGAVTDSAKTDAGNREVYIQPELAQVVKRIRHFVKLDNLKTRRKSALFFPGINYFTYNKYLKENSASIIGHEITPHALRHTHVSLLAEQGVPLDVISRRVGHEDSTVTRKIYLHVTDKQKQKDRDRIAQVRLFG